MSEELTEHQKTLLISWLGLPEDTPWPPDARRILKAKDGVPLAEKTIEKLAAAQTERLKQFQLSYREEVIQAVTQGCNLVASAAVQLIDEAKTMGNENAPLAGKLHSNHYLAVAAGLPLNFTEADASAKMDTLLAAIGDARPTKAQSVQGKALKLIQAERYKDGDAERFGRARKKIHALLRAGGIQITADRDSITFSLQDKNDVRPLETSLQWLGFVRDDIHASPEESKVTLQPANIMDLAVLAAIDPSLKPGLIFAPPAHETPPMISNSHPAASSVQKQPASTPARAKLVAKPAPKQEEPLPSGVQVAEYSAGKSPVPRLTEAGLRELLLDNAAFDFMSQSGPNKPRRCLAALKEQIATGVVRVGACTAKSGGGGLRFTYHPENERDEAAAPAEAQQAIITLLKGIGFESPRLFRGKSSHGGNAFVTLGAVDIGEMRVLGDCGLISADQMVELWGEMKRQEVLHPPAPVSTKSQDPRWS